MKQLAMFKNFKKWLDVKIETNRKVIISEKNNEEFEGQVNIINWMRKKNFF